VLQGDWAVLGVLAPLVSVAYLFNRYVFNLCMKIFLYFRTQNISLESAVHWLSEDAFKYKVDVGV